MAEVDENGNVSKANLKATPSRSTNVPLTCTPLST